MYPLPGYWSSSPLSAPIACPNPLACPGVDRNSISGIGGGVDPTEEGDGATQPQTDTQRCSEEYKGELCELCATGYYKSGDVCWSCGSDSSSDAYFSFVLLVALLVLFLLSLSIGALNSVWLGHIIVAFVLLQNAVSVGTSGVSNLPSSFHGLSQVFTIMSVINFEVEMFKVLCLDGKKRGDLKKRGVDRRDC